ncbi:hypothetical protein D932_02050 [Enterococcus casseliflavus 14-MB-W-14]|nr:hypothetical protein D932_02050 [Enterococcus casseliflavus 14-MB-W-14]
MVFVSVGFQKRWFLSSIYFIIAMFVMREKSINSLADEIDA